MKYRLIPLFLLLAPYAQAQWIVSDPGHTAQTIVARVQDAAEHAEDEDGEHRSRHAAVHHLLGAERDVVISRQTGVVDGRVGNAIAPVRRFRMILGPG